jgi:hypothetical protein
MSYIDPDLLHGELDNFITFVGNNTAALTTAGFNATTVQTNLTTIKTDLSGKKTTRDNQKTALAVAQASLRHQRDDQLRRFQQRHRRRGGRVGQTDSGGQTGAELPQTCDRFGRSCQSQPGAGDGSGQIVGFLRNPFSRRLHSTRFLKKRVGFFERLTGLCKRRAGFGRRRVGFWEKPVGSREKRVSLSQRRGRRR